MNNKTKKIKLIKKWNGFPIGKEFDLSDVQVGLMLEHKICELVEDEKSVDFKDKVDNKKMQPENVKRKYNKRT